MQLLKQYIKINSNDQITKVISHYNDYRGKNKTYWKKCGSKIIIFFLNILKLIFTSNKQFL